MAQGNDIERTLSKTSQVRPSDRSMSIPDEVMDLLKWKLGEPLRLTLNLSTGTLIVGRADVENPSR